jgi:pilus assembly protein Flp/PilA
MRRLVTRFLDDEGGATAIEYGLIVALVAVAALGALTAFGGVGSGVFNRAMTTISDALRNA